VSPSYPSYSPKRVSFAQPAAELVSSPEAAASGDKGSTSKSGGAPHKQKWGFGQWAKGKGKGKSKGKSKGKAYFLQREAKRAAKAQGDTSQPSSWAPGQMLQRLVMEPAAAAAAAPAAGAGEASAAT